MELRNRPDLKHMDPSAARLQLRRMGIDTFTGMAISNLIAFFIMLTTAVTLHQSGTTNIETSAQAAQALRPVAGQFAFLAFSLGIIGTGFLAVPVLAGSAAGRRARLLWGDRGGDGHCPRRAVFAARPDQDAVLVGGRERHHLGPDPRSDDGPCAPAPANGQVRRNSVAVDPGLGGNPRNGGRNHRDAGSRLNPWLCGCVGRLLRGAGRPTSRL